MKRVATIGLVLTLVAFVCAGSLDALAANQPKAHQAQTTHTFVNNEASPAYGLLVELSGPAEVKTDDESGQAGPFRDVRGNGTGKIVLSNPDRPIEPGSDGFELVFRSYAKQIAVKAWWWTDVKGKRIGKKNKG